MGAGGQFEMAGAHDEVFVDDVAGGQGDGFVALGEAVGGADGVGSGGQDEVGILGVADPERADGALAIG